MKRFKKRIEKKRSKAHFKAQFALDPGLSVKFQRFDGLYVRTRLWESTWRHWKYRTKTLEESLNILFPVTYAAPQVENLVYARNPFLSLMPKSNESIGQSYPMPIIFG